MTTLLRLQWLFEHVVLWGGIFIVAYLGSKICLTRSLLLHRCWWYYCWFPQLLHAYLIGVYRFIVTEVKVVTLMFLVCVVSVRLSRSRSLFISVRLVPSHFNYFQMTNSHSILSAKADMIVKYMCIHVNFKDCNVQFQ